jgi:SAM-dependent methyltransferase
MQGTGIKEQAIRVHHEQAPLFESRYRTLSEEFYSSTFNYGRLKMGQIFEREFSTFAPGSRALEVGCGVGHYLQKLSQHGFSPVGVEPAAAMRNAAIRNNPQVTVLDGEAESLPFDDGTFDLAIAVEVIRYFPNPRGALREMARVTRKGGKVIVTAAPRYSLNGYVLLNKITSRLSVPTFTKVRHSFMSVREARAIMAAAGLANTRIYGLCFGPWQPVERLAKAVLPAALRRWEPVDDSLAKIAPLKNFANHFVIVGEK